MASLRLIQIVFSAHVFVQLRRDLQHLRLDPVEQRYAWPSELDLMAQIAGLHLKDRWGGWSHEPYVSASEFHVSVYGR